MCQVYGADVWQPTSVKNASHGQLQVPVRTTVPPECLYLHYDAVPLALVLDSGLSCAEGNRPPNAVPQAQELQSDNCAPDYFSLETSLDSFGPLSETAEQKQQVS